jgi:phosphonate transport system ATP-binding protein
LTLTIRSGERVAVIGPSGAGKTTLLRLLNTSLSPSEGTVEVLGGNPALLGPSQLRALRVRVATVYQQLLLVPQVSVLQNVVAGRLGKMPLWKAVLALVSRAEAARVWSVLEQVGIEEKIYERVDRLSGGEQQRVAIARALYQEPEVLIADEPVASVDPTRSEEIVELLGKVGQGRTLLVSTHRLEALLPVISRVIGIRGGQILFDKYKSELNLDDLAQLYESQKGTRPPSAPRPVSPGAYSSAGVAFIGASNTPGEFILPKLVREFVQDCPGVRVSLSVKGTAEITKDLLGGRLDLAFVGARTPNPALHFEEFAQDEIILVAAPSFNALPAGSISASQVALIPRVEREPGSGTRAVVEDHFANMGIPLSPAAVALEVGTLIGLKAAVISGIGAAFTSRRAVQSELAAGVLRELPVQSVKIPRRIFVAWRSAGELPLAARSFLEVARKQSGGLR